MGQRLIEADVYGKLFRVMLLGLLQDLLDLEISRSQDDHLQIQVHQFREGLEHQAQALLDSQARDHPNQWNRTDGQLALLLQGHLADQLVHEAFWIEWNGKVGIP